jgi:hypothetical protein
MVAVLAVTAGVASAGTLTYTGQGFTGDNLTTSKCGAPDNGGTGMTIPANGNYLLFVFTNGPSTGPVTLHIGANTYPMVQVGGTWKVVTPSFTKAQLLAGPTYVEINGTVARNAQLVVSHGCLQVPTSVETNIHNANHDVITSAALGSVVHDSAKVTVSNPAVPIPAGSYVTFKFYKDSTLLTTENVNVDTTTGLAHPTADTSALHAGSYHYSATFTSGASNVGNSIAADEPLTINKGDLKIVTTIHNANHTGITEAALGSVVHDTATVTTLGGSTPGFAIGTITFSASGTGLKADKTNPAESGFDASTVDSDPLAAGTSYSYGASVAANDDYNAATSDPEPLTINKAQLIITTTIHKSDHTVLANGGSVNTGSSVHDTATITGQVTGFTAPGASDVSFTLDGGAIGSDNGNVDPIRSVAVTPTVGDHKFAASVTGNDNYLGATSADEPFKVVAQQTFCSPGFWKNEPYPSPNWTLVGHAPTDSFNATVAAAGFYPTISPDQTLDYVMNNNNLYGAAGQYNLTGANAVGAYLSSLIPASAGGTGNSGSTTENCPLSRTN